MSSARDARRVLQQLRKIAESPEPCSGPFVAALAEQLHGTISGLPLDVLVADLEAPLILATLARRLLEDLERLMAAGASPMASGMVQEAAMACAKGLFNTTCLNEAYPGDGRATPAQRRSVEQLQASQLLPVLARQLDSLASALVPDEQHPRLAAAAAARPQPWMALCAGLLRWFDGVHRAWPGGVFAAPAPGRLIVPAARMLVAASLLAGPALAACQGRMTPDFELLVMPCLRICAVVTTFAANARQGRELSMQPPLVDELQRAPCFMRVVLLAVLYTACCMAQQRPRSGSRSMSGNSSGSSSSIGSPAEPQQAAHAAHIASLMQMGAALGLTEAVVATACALQPAPDADGDAAPEPHTGPGVWLTCLMELEDMLATGLSPRLAAVAAGAASEVLPGRPWQPRVRPQQLVSLTPAQHALLLPVPLALLSTADALSRMAGVCEVEVEFEGISTAAHIAVSLLELLLATQPAAAVASLPQLLVRAASLLERSVQHSGAVTQRTRSATLMRLVHVLLALSPHEPDVPTVAAWLPMAASICGSVEALVRKEAVQVITTWGVPVALCEANLSVISSLCALAIVSCGVAPSAARSVPLLLAAAATPAGSAEQQRLFSLVITCNKLAWHLRHLVNACWLSGMAISHALVATSFDGAAGGASSSSSRRGEASSSSPAAAAADLVPWPVLMAHSLHLSGALLEELMSDTAAIMAHAGVIRRSACIVNGAAAGLERFCSHGLAAAGPGAGGSTAATVSGSPAAAGASKATWAHAHPVVQQLQRELLPALQQADVLLRRAAAGSDQRTAPGTAISANSISSKDAAAAAAAVGLDPALLAAVEAAGSDDAAVLLVLRRSGWLATSLPAQLQAAAGALSAALPHRFCCNHPGCTNLAASSELALVGGNCNCAGCHTARYCSKDCQAAHWPHHKPVCRRLKREAAAVAATAGGV